jgi:3-oxoacyl-[acyl-carrier protein] reductase
MRNIIVTGGSRGLGLGIACTLVNAGYRVIAVARRESEALAAARESLGNGREGALQFKCFDLADVTDIPALVKAIRKEFGPIYGLVNNAAAGANGILATTQTTEIERVVRLNTVSSIILTKYVVRSMMVDGAGRIVNIASIVSFTGFKGLAVYSATKASIVGFTRSLAREIGPLGINVNAIAPGFVDTELTSSLVRAERTRVVQRSPLRRLAEIDDIAHAVEFLLGDKARNITGTVLTVDAGSTA